MKKFPFWLTASILTLGAAVFQRVTGPSYPVKGRAAIGGQQIRYMLPRSTETGRNAEIRAIVVEPYEGYIEYRRAGSADAARLVPMSRKGGELVGLLPSMPPAGRAGYRVFITGGGRSVELTGGREAVVRFKAHVPAGLLIPHIIIMFAGMLLATAAGLAALDRNRDPRPYVKAAVVLLFLGGFVFGPLVQKAAFGVFWSGFPHGTDMTDNKTMVSFLFWIAAWAAGRKGRPARGLTLAASLVTLLIYLIPHSLMGSGGGFSKIGG